MYDGEAEKLKHKNALEQLRWDLENRFEFSEILVDALMRRFEMFLEENDFVDEQGRITYWATADDQPPGRTQGEMKKVRVRLTLCHPEDITLLQQGGTPEMREDGQGAWQTWWGTHEWSVQMLVPKFDSLGGHFGIQAPLYRHDFSRLFSVTCKFIQRSRPSRWFYLRHQGSTTTGRWRPCGRRTRGTGFSRPRRG